jgi:hypothetical protein
MPFAVRSGKTSYYLSIRVRETVPALHWYAFSGLIRGLNICAMKTETPLQHAMDPRC